MSRPGGNAPPGRPRGDDVPPGRSRGDDAPPGRPSAPSRPGRTRTRRWASVAALLWIAGLFALSSWSAGDGALDFWWRFPHDDKAVHALLYGVLGGLLRVATGRIGGAVAIAGAVGIADETWQAAIPGRSADALDWVADVLGAFAGAVLVSALARGRWRRAIE